MSKTAPSRVSCLRFSAFLLLIATVAGLQAQGVIFSASPNLSLPLAPAGLYSLAAGASLDLRLATNAETFEGIARMGYEGLVIDQGLGTVSVVSVLGGAAWPFIKTPAFSLGPTLLAGGYGAFRAGSSALLNPMVQGGLRAELKLGAVRLALEPGAEFLISKQDGKIGPFLASAGLRFSVALTPGGAAHRSLLKIGNPSLDPFFPVIYKFYSGNPFGTATITNGERQAITSVEASFFVPAYMDGPQTIAAIPSIKSGESAALSIEALFKNAVLAITETDTAQARIHVKYYLGKDTYSADWDGTIRIEGRNAIVWNDDRIAAAFVTARDPTVLKLARNTVASLPKDGPSIPSEPIREAAILYQSLESYGLKYVIDPKGSYATMKGKAEAVDYLQFPVETLAYKTGDCDDLSTLYLAMLESVGIETAYVTVPGHIYSAFALDAGLDSAKGFIANMDRLIVIDGKPWVPVETTALGKGFAAAWSLGAREWKDATALGQGPALIPVHDSWRTFEPSFISSSEKQDVVEKFPDPAKVAIAYATAMKAAADKELAALVSSISGGDPASKLSAATRNRLGAVSARYGQIEKAEAYFKEASAGYAPALFNLGNVRFLKKDYSGAADLYGKVLASQPTNVEATLGLARAQFEKGRYAEATKAFETAKGLSPNKAAAFSYLAEGASASAARAADPTARLAVDWSE